MAHPLWHHGQRWLNRTRPRIFMWYFLLTAFSSVASLLATHHIFYERIRTQAEDYVQRQVEQFRTITRNYPPITDEFSEADAAALFDRFLESYRPVVVGDYAIALLNDGHHQHSDPFPVPLLERDADLIARWQQLAEPEKGRVETSVGEMFYMAEPVVVNGQSLGVLVVMHCAENVYALVDGAVLIIIPVTLGVMGIGAAIAWATAGRVLAPLRLLTQTAHAITDTDMTRRIPVDGTDEIAELTATFNAMLDRLQTAFESQQEFLKDAGHELRTPITVIRGYLETLKYRPKRQEQTIALAVDELDRMGRMVNDLLLLAKAECPDFLTLKSEELDWLTEEIFLKVRSLADRHWKLESKGLSPVRVDRQRLTQAVMNLVQNAIRHTEEGDVIALGSSVRENHIHLWVTDTGEGIAPEDQQRIFERFVRATTRDDGFEGHGLGLSIVQAIAQAHGGWVELSSRPGQGSTFTIVMPLEPSFDSTSHESDSHHRRQPTHHGLFGIWPASPRLHDHRR